MKRIAWIALTVVALLAWTRPAAAQDDDLSMDVAVGFDGYCRVGSWCSVYVVISNEGVDVEGELRIPLASSGGGFGSGNHEYRKRVTLPAHSRKAYFMYLPLGGSGSRSDLEVSLRVGSTVFVSGERVTWLGESERAYGVVSSDNTAFSFLGSVAPVGGRAVVAYPDLESLPPAPLGWEGLDMLILNDVDTTALDEERRQALETWVAHGGHLIVGGGAGAARTAAGVADLLPVSIGGTRSVDDLWALGLEVGAPVATGPYAVAEAELKDGGTLVAQDGLILLARRAHGAGMVDFLAFDAGLNPFTDWSDNAALWGWIIEPDVLSAQRLTVGDGYRARSAIDALPGLQLPSTLVILGFLLTYIVLIGPINYVILRKLDRRELAWLTIPVLILGCSACAYVTGSQIRGVSAIVHRLAVVYVPEGSRVGRVSQAVGLFSPRRADYDVRVVGGEVRDIYDYGGGMGGQSLRVFEEAEGAMVDDLRVDVGGIEPFVAEGYVDVPGVEANLRLVRRSANRLWLEGTVRNGEVPLEDAVVLTRSSEERLGDLEAGQEVSVRLLFSGQSNTTSLPERIFGTYYGYGGNIDQRRRYNFLEAVFGPSSRSGGMVPSRNEVLDVGAYLIGWTETEVPFPVEVIGQSSSEIRTALYVYALPVGESEPGEPGAMTTIPPGLIEREVMGTKGYVEMEPDGFYMPARSEVTFRFTVWPGVTMPQVDDIVLDVQEGGYGSSSDPPAISLWNQGSGTWDRLDVGWGGHLISNAEPYVTSSGSVLLRLEAGDTGAYVKYPTITIRGQ